MGGMCEGKGISMIPSITEFLAVTVAAALLFAYHCPGLLRTLAARCLTRAHVVEVSRRAHDEELARWKLQLGTSHPATRLFEQKGINA